jgi:2-amino-4-hydroxy-6-hydroxymethyldihydropteridine diphosphokinase
VFVGLGSNQGDRRRALAQAVRSIRRWPEVTVVAVSSLYETAYVGPGDQPAYLNACVELRTSVAPARLLQWGQALERDAGRAPDGHLRPRPLDVDLLLYGRDQVCDEDLVVPHPRLAARRFVLEPLAELGVLDIPGIDRSTDELLGTREIRRQSVHRVENPRWWEREAA